MPSLNLAVAIVLCLVALLAGAGIAGMVSYRKGIAAGVEQRKQQAEAAIGSAEKERLPTVDFGMEYRNRAVRPRPRKVLLLIRPFSTSGCTASTMVSAG